MLVDNPLQSGISMSSAFEDYFNMDLLAGPSDAATNSSGSPRSDSSPSNTFSTLPPTPPNPLLDSAMQPSPFYDFSLDDDFSKIDLPAPLAAPGFDFFGAFSTAAAQICNSGGGSGNASSSSGSSPDSIDPQLVNTPAQSQPMSEFGDDAEDENEEEEEAEREDSPDAQDSSLAPFKVGGRGKANRKGTVQSGGVVKRAGSEKKENRPSNMLSTTSSEPDDWRPSPEEYKKMSSKEKRQLRNKISARNFRVRRKEYITTLEGDIAERDRLIDAIRTELGSTKSENVALRQEISALKKALLEGRGRPDTPILPPPAPLPAIPASVFAASSSKSSSPAPAAPKSPLLTPNTQKDLPTSPRLGARGFWGGASAGGIGGFGGFTPVHTTLVPEWGSVLSGKALAGAKNGRKSPSLQENINPILNAAFHGTDKSKEQQPQQIGGLDSFMEMNAFNMNLLDAYRMQLWRNVAVQQQFRNHHAHQQQQQHQSHASPSPSPLSSPSGLASGLRPHFFSKQGPTTSAVLSGKAATSSHPTSSVFSSSTHNVTANQPKSQPTPTPQQAMLASMASQTLVRKLGSAFWDAFAARPSGVAASGRRAPQEFDADKVRRVMEGSAVLRVVDVEPQAQANRAAVPQPASVRPPQTSQTSSCERMCPINITDLLEESMRTLSLGKK
ncbi:hypothetical protein IEO21_06572 [Rhodonia placenta]|uniref:BZIP domain-containing protein n=1 Tax=Rhodonia placenta TaxID=104341 RepID=A0A8H7NZP0_9APHY|nr:hypothetical protein IEO21_06572 [Postia placenta]